MDEDKSLAEFVREEPASPNAMSLLLALLRLHEGNLAFVAGDDESEPA